MQNLNKQNLPKHYTSIFVYVASFLGLLILAV